MTVHRPHAGIFLAAYAVDALIHLAAQLAGARLPADVTQVLAMPLLIGYLLASAPRTRLVTLTVAALGFSWLGDTLPRFTPQSAAFLVLVGSFFVAQILYIAAFWPDRSRSVLQRPAVAPYASLYVVLLVLCIPKAGPLLVPLVVYGVTLIGMAVLSTGVHRFAAIGGVLFVVSDGLIALTMLSVVRFSLSSFTIMLTYLIAQLLLVSGVIHRSRVSATTASPVR